MTGTLHIIGMGPGDPELLTLKAARLLRAAPVIAHFARHDRTGHARRIADGFIRADVRELRFDYPHTTEIDAHDPRYRADMAACYDAAATVVGACLQSSQDVALLCEGDPFFYGSAMYVFDRLHPRYRTTIVPGITGMAAGWAGARVPITRHDDMLTILPGTWDEDRLAARLADTDAAVVMKLGRNLPKLRRALHRAGRFDDAIYVERASMDGERICKLSEMDGAAPYFSLVLLAGRG